MKCFYDCVRIDSVIDNKINTPKITISSKSIPCLSKSAWSQKLWVRYIIEAGLVADLKIHLLECKIRIKKGGKVLIVC